MGTDAGTVRAGFGLGSILIIVFFVNTTTVNKMVQSAAEDIIKWSNSLSGWKRDALRRLSCLSDLTNDDRNGLLLLAKKEVGFDCGNIELSTIEPLCKSHIATSSGASNVKITALQNIKSVNQLVPSASLEFHPNKLTVIYGRNGSGKSGFVRILRSACHTRLVNEKDLKILSDVYGKSDTPQSAEIVIESGTGIQTLDWSASSNSHETLQHISVFDSKSARLYIDTGNQIQFLPFGLDLPEKFNTLCLELKTILEPENQDLSHKLEIKSVKFAEFRDSPSQIFYNQLTENTPDEQIEVRCSISDLLKTKHKDIDEGLITRKHAIQTLKATASFTETLANECKNLTDSFSDAAFLKAQNAVKEAIDAQAAAGIAAKESFNKEPLQGVGSPEWRLMWEAAKEYSIVHAYPEDTFPVLGHTPDSANCVLCQQTLEIPTVDRMKRFQAFMESTLKIQVENKLASVKSILSKLPSLDVFATPDFEERLASLRDNHKDLVQAVNSFKANIIVRRDVMSNLLSQLVELEGEIIPQPNIESQLRNVSANAKKNAAALESADDPDKKALVIKRRDELADQIMLSDNKTVIIERRNLLKKRALYDKLSQELNTANTTAKSTQLIKKHVTQNVLDQFEIEQANFNITHLKIKLARKTSKGKAEFKTDTGTSLTGRTSDILSEGEQQALALSAFFTEIEVCEGNGTIIFDDPVSSLDRERGQKVANRIVQEAKVRQVIVFTHDIVFLNQLRNTAHQNSVSTDYQHIFRDEHHSGKIDPNELPWKGKSFEKRIKWMKQKHQDKKKVHETSPAEWETEVKGLYGNLRDTYERMVEEDIFKSVIQRGTDVISTMMLRYVNLSDDIAESFHKNFTKISAHAHDNPASESIATPTPNDYLTDIVTLEKLREEIIAECKATEKRRPSMKKAP